MTRETNLIVVVKEVDLYTNCIYSHNHMVGMDKIFSSDRSFCFGTPIKEWSHKCCALKIITMHIMYGIQMKYASEHANS
jgi:hypothetical protein